MSADKGQVPDKYREPTVSERWAEAMERNRIDSQIKKGFFRRNEMALMFGFAFVSIHIIWYNMQRTHVPIEHRTEIKAYHAIKKKWDDYWTPENVNIK